MPRPGSVMVVHREYISVRSSVLAALLIRDWLAAERDACTAAGVLVVNPDGTLVYSFVESVKATFPFYLIRLIGGLMYLSGMGVMCWNTVMTVKAGRAVPAPIPRLAAHAAA